MSHLSCITVFKPRYLVFLCVSALSVLLVSCGGGGTTAGIGGSGIGGTGVTLVRGNVATVTAALERTGRGGSAQMLAVMAEFVSRTAIAQAGGVSGIQVSGGGKQDVTDDLGRFDLVDVVPSANFVLTLVLDSGQRIDFGIGAVPDMTVVEVNNIVVDSTSGTARPSSVDVTDNSDDDSAGDEGDSVDDADSTDDISQAEDDNSQAEDDNSQAEDDNSAGDEEDPDSSDDV